MLKYFQCMRRRFIGALSVMAVICLLSINAVHAQDDAPDDPNDGGELGGETGVPFDSGVSMLVVTAVSYGVKIAYDARKKG